MIVFTLANPGEDEPDARVLVNSNISVAFPHAQGTFIQLADRTHVIVTASFDEVCRAFGASFRAAGLATIGKEDDLPDTLENVKLPREKKK